MNEGSRLARDFFERPAEDVAADLVGCLLSTIREGRLTDGRIVETEAYGGPDDLASHAAIYHRSRTAIMTSLAGMAYVYRSYGIHACFNVVARTQGGTGAVLIRAIEPLHGLETMIERRGTDRLRLLCSGPGRLTQAFAICLNDNGRDVVADDTIAVAAGRRQAAVVATSRIGITRDVDRLWRFCEAGSSFLSRPIPARTET